jgi:hypothetical protein
VPAEGLRAVTGNSARAAAEFFRLEVAAAVGSSGKKNGPASGA